jgi:hypothetical protein
MARLDAKTMPRPRCRSGFDAAFQACIVFVRDQWKNAL